MRIFSMSVNHLATFLAGGVVTSIALDELRVYWTDGYVVYYVNRSLPSTRMNGSHITSVRSLLSMSPGRQPQFGV